MNKKIIIVPVLAVLLFVCLPILVFAQSYKYLSADMQQKISALGDVPVKELPMPVLFVSVKDILPNFGDARTNRLHQGQDIMAPKGTPVVSPTAAVVLGVEKGPICGNMVYTANPGGETFYYIHLDRFGEGVVVGKVLEPGSLIGYVGNTGDAAGGAPHLHFQINNKLDVAENPFPRLVVEFTPEQKALFLAAITPTVAGASTTAVSNSTSIYDEDLDVGSTGDKVVALQKYLIEANSGLNARILKKSGATGKFGALTKAALIEWQKAVGILPATGHYGAKSQAYILSHSSLAQNTTTTTTTLGKKISITRELYLGVSGEDVLALQKLLNANGYIIAKTGLGSVGHETNYFGKNTKEAVRKFQIAKKIFPAEGNVGPKTIAALLAL